MAHGSAIAAERTGGRADERGPWDRERGGDAHAKEIGANKSTPLGSERERGKREREWAQEGIDGWGPPVRESWRAGARGGDGLIGLNWGFLIFWNFPLLFHFIFFMDSNQIQTPIQIQIISNMCIKQKNNLGST
jgi:hypothetical protein